MADVFEIQRNERAEKPSVYVKEFRRDHEMRPELNDSGEPTGKKTLQEIVWVTYAPRGVAGRDVEEKWHRLKRLNPAVYEALLPAYDHFMRGEQIPEGGTALSSWSGVTAGQATRLKELGVRSVEDIAAMNDAAMDRFGMGARALKEAAGAWLGSREGAGIAHELTELREMVKMQAEALEDQRKEILALRAKAGDDGQPKSRKAA